MFSDGLLRKFKYNENISKSKYATESQKMEAWKKNKIILEQLYHKEQNATVRNALLANHFDGINTEKYTRNNYEATESKAVNEEAVDEDIIVISDFETSFEPESHTNKVPELPQTPINSMKIQKTKEIEPFATPPPTNVGKKKKVDIVQEKDCRWGSMTNFLIKPKAKPVETPVQTPVEHVQAIEKPSTSRACTEKPPVVAFRTALEELQIRTMKINGTADKKVHSENSCRNNGSQMINFGATKKSLGARLNGRAKFNVPTRSDGSTSDCSNSEHSSSSSSTTTTVQIVEEERYKNIEPRMIEFILNEIIHKLSPIDWSDIAGLDYAKYVIREAAVLPQLRPDIYKGLRGPPRGILLFGPPGTGKTLIGKCIASQSKSTFFSISASALTSKYVGEGEKMVRALFAVAAVQKPSVIFIDEIDSLLSQRNESEHESTRRLKTEFLVQIDGVGSAETDRIVVVGATNRPQELDDAARRRLVRRLYIPLPEMEARKQILTNMLRTVRNNLTEEDITSIAEQTDGYSGADMESLCKEASMEPLRSIPVQDILHFKEENIRDVDINDFKSGLQCVRPSVSPNEIEQYIEWNRLYGSLR